MSSASSSAYRKSDFEFMLQRYDMTRTESPCACSAARAAYLVGVAVVGVAAAAGLGGLRVRGWAGLRVRDMGVAGGAREWGWEVNSRAGAIKNHK